MPPRLPAFGAPSELRASTYPRHYTYSAPPVLHASMPPSLHACRVPPARHTYLHVNTPTVCIQPVRITRQTSVSSGLKTTSSQGTEQEEVVARGVPYPGACTTDLNSRDRMRFLHQSRVKPDATSSVITIPTQHGQHTTLLAENSNSGTFLLATQDAWHLQYLRSVAFSRWGCACPLACGFRVFVEVA